MVKQDPWVLWGHLNWLRVHTTLPVGLFLALFVWLSTGCARNERSRVVRGESDGAADSVGVASNGPNVRAADSGPELDARGANAATGAKGSTHLRVVSLSPSTTEALFAINAGSELVGRSRFCDTPPEVRSLPAVGGYTDPNFEAILALSPTLVIGARGPIGPRITERLGARGIETFFPETESVDQILAMLIDLGKRVGHADDGMRVAHETRARIDRVSELVRTRSSARKPRVLLLFDAEPVVAAGPKSFPDDLLVRAGGTNVVTDGGAYPVLNVERVMGLDPDVIVDTTMAANHAPSRVRKDAPGWAKVRAVRDGHVVAVSDESVLRPGPRIADAVETFAKILYPELAGSIGSTATKATPDVRPAPPPP